MTLLDFMRERELDDAAMASLIGDCSPSAVKKWKYRERSPDIARIIRIEEVTGGNVGLHDWSVRRTEPAASDRPAA